MMIPKQDRPLNINPFSIRLPVMAWVSVAHRLSGLIVFFLIPLALWALQHSLASSEGFEAVRIVFAHFGTKFFLWVFISALSFHLLAGIRHLFMDIKWGNSLSHARFSARLVWVLSIIAAGFLAYCIYK